MISKSWLLLLYGLPTKQTAERVNLWRKLKRFGALQLKTSAYVLPDTPANYERFQWLTKQVRDGGGDATLIRVTAIEGLSSEQIAGLFNDARNADYRNLGAELNKFIARNTKRRGKSFNSELEKFHQRFNDLREIDYFQACAAHDTELLLQQAEAPLRKEERPFRILRRADFVGRTWLTRPRPEIDRVGSAWLIQKFIDPKARFVFAARPGAHPKATPYDMADVEFTHCGEDCTFETLVKRFGVHAAAVTQIAEMIHDADLEDGKFGRTECVGLDRLFKGWAKLGWSDQEILSTGFKCFDALHATL